MRIVAVTFTDLQGLQEVVEYPATLALRRAKALIEESQSSGYLGAPLTAAVCKTLGWSLVIDSNFSIHTEKTHADDPSPEPDEHPVPTEPPEIALLRVAVNMLRISATALTELVRHQIKNQEPPPEQ